MKFRRFVDGFAQEVGKTLLLYFDHEDFPMELLEQDPVLRLLYMRFECEKVTRERSLTEEEHLDLMCKAFKSLEARGGLANYPDLYKK